MYKKLLTFFAISTNAAVWAAFTRLVTEIANFVSLNADLDQATQTQGYNTKGITAGKSDAFTDMVKMTVDMAYKAYVWAVDNNNDELTEVFNVKLSDFDNTAASTSFDKVKNIRNAINTNIAGMAAVNLLPADVTALDALIAAYDAVKSAPEVAIGHKETSTDTIVELFHDIDESLELISRLIISQYSTTNAGLVSDFKNNKHIDDLPTHHSGIHTHITDALTGEDVEGAVLSIPAAGKTATSNINGIAEIIKVKSGTYHVFVNKEGYQTQPFKTKIIRGKITSFNIQMAQGNGGGVTAIREGDVFGPAVVTITINDIVPTPATHVIIEITGNAVQLYAAPTAGGPPAGVIFDMPIGTQTKTLAEFLALTGIGTVGDFLNIRNVGIGPSHYKLTFTNVAE